MATPLTKAILREVETDRGRRFVELTPRGVIVREPGQRDAVAVPFSAIEDLGWKIKAKQDGHPIPRPRGRR